MPNFVPILVLFTIALPVFALETQMPWQRDARFAALSNTAFAITGDITLTGTAEDKTLTTANGTEISLHFVANRSSGWNLSDPEIWPGAIFAIHEDPGPLENGNTLCGDGPATYLVFTPLQDDIAGSILQIAVFAGAMPENIDSNGLCGTLSYDPGQDRS